MALSNNLALVFMAIIMVASLQLQPTAAKTRHIVGGAMGWTIPAGGAAAYTAWASKRTFHVGDTLFFNFTTGLHNVAEVSQAAYGPCSASNTLSLDSNGPATVRLTRPGRHYYTCTVVSHCQIGQKLSINVAPATTTPQTTEASAPSTFELSPVGSPIPPVAVSGAPSFTAAVVPVALLAGALGLFW